MWYKNILSRQNGERILLMEHVNMMSINQRAKEALQEIDEEPREGSFYCIQLVSSVLSRGEIEAEEDLAQTVQAMAAWRPERIMNFLLIAPGTEYDPKGWQKQKITGNWQRLSSTILKKKW